MNPGGVLINYPAGVYSDSGEIRNQVWSLSHQKVSVWNEINNSTPKRHEVVCQQKSIQMQDVTKAGKIFNL